MSVGPRRGDERYNLAADEDLVRRLRAGDEAAFLSIVNGYTPGLRRAVLAYVRDAAVAEEVVQEAWIGVLKGLPSFAGRSSLRSWIFAIAINQAKTRAVREARTVPFSVLARDETERSAPAVDAERFAGADARYPGHWKTAPASWGERPDEKLLRREVREQIDRAIDGLPPAQRAVVVLKDVGNVSTMEACNALGLSETNLRVLLHRGRAKVRRSLEVFFSQSGEAK